KGRNAGQVDAHQGHRAGQREKAARARHLPFRADRKLDRRGREGGGSLSRLRRAHCPRRLDRPGKGVCGEKRGSRVMATKALLKVQDVETYYGNIRALSGVSIDVNEGEIVTLIGANGAGKSTLMMTIFGTPRGRSRTSTFGDADITRRPTQEIERLRRAQSPEGRRMRRPAA